MKRELTEEIVRKEIVGSFLREKRIASGMTQWMVAHGLRYKSAQFVSNWERGLSVPPLASWPRLLTLLKVEPAEVLATMARYWEQIGKLEQQRLAHYLKHRGKGRSRSA